MINWIKNNIKMGLKCADRVEDFSTEMFYKGYATAMQEVLDELEDLKVDVSGQLLSVDRIDMETEGNIIVIPVSSLERRFKDE